MTEEKKSRLPIILGWLFGFLFFVGIAAVWYLTSPEFLVTLLSSDNVQSRRWAADELVRQGDGAGKQALGVAMNQSVDLEARRLAIFILGEIHYREATPQLLSFFKGDNPTLQEQSAYALGRMGDASLGPELVSAYDAAPKGLKMKIISALGELPTEPGKALLKRESATSTDETIRGAAAYSYNKLVLEKKKAGGAR
jgi:HEAT repeat protein